MVRCSKVSPATEFGDCHRVSVEIGQNPEYQSYFRAVTIAIGFIWKFVSVYWFWELGAPLFAAICWAKISGRWTTDVFSQPILNFSWCTFIEDLFPGTNSIDL